MRVRRRSRRIDRRTYISIYIYMDRSIDRISNNESEVARYLNKKITKDAYTKFTYKANKRGRERKRNI